MSEMTPSVADSATSRLPAHLQEVEYNRLTALIKHYYDWQMQVGQPTEFLHNIMKYRDVDTTTPGLLEHLTESLLNVVPAYSITNRSYLTKHIGEFLLSKGSIESFELIMRAVFGEEIVMEFNSNKLFRPSSNAFERDAVVVVESDTTWEDIEGAELIQEAPYSARAIIISETTTVHNGKLLHWLQLDDKSIVGKFVEGGAVYSMHGSIDRSWFKITKYLTPVSMLSGILKFNIAKEENRPYDNLVVKQLYSDFRCVVTGFKERFPSTAFTQVDLRVKDVTGTFDSTNPLYMFPVQIEDTLITEENIERGVVSHSVVGVNMTNTGSLYTIGDTVSFISGSGVNAKGYVAETSGGSIEQVTVNNAGFGYSVGDIITVIDGNTSGQHASMEVAAIDGVNGAVKLTTELSTVAIAAGGDNFKVNDVVTLVGYVEAGTDYATVQVSAVNSAWLFKRVIVDAAGTGYPSYSNVALINATTLVKYATFAATASFTADGGIKAVDVTLTPVIATNNLKVIVNGYGATLTATVATGAVTAIPVVIGGVNYVDPVVILNGDGFGAAATPVMVAGVITSVVVNHGGSGYTTATATIAERYGVGAVLRHVIQDQTNASGAATALTILTRGKYIELPPCFDYPPPNRVGVGEGLKINSSYRTLSAKVTNGGSYYSAATMTTSGAGTGAVFRPYIVDGVVTSITLVSGGTGYVADSTYVYITVGVGFVGRAEISGGIITSISVLAGGSGYVSDSLVIVVGAGTGANFNLTTGGNLTNGVLGVAVTNGGRNYFHGTTMSITGGTVAAALTPIITGGVITKVLSTGGAGYSPAQLETLTVNPGTTNVITNTLTGNGSIVGYRVASKGAGYYTQSEVPPLTITAAAPGFGATFAPTLDSKGGLVKVEVISGGEDYVLNPSMTITGGLGTGAVLKAVVYLGRITDVIVIAPGHRYKYGTTAVVIGDGNNAVITPVVESGITDVDVIYGGSSYSAATTIGVIDDVTGTPGTGAVVIPTIVGGVITALTITNRGTGYRNPVLSINNSGQGVGAAVSAKAERYISNLTITNKGFGYTYADLIIVGDGNEAEFILKYEKLGAIESVAIGTVGTGFTETPAVTIADNSGHGGVTRVKIKTPGSGYKQTPSIYLPIKRAFDGAITADGVKMTCYGSKIGNVRKVAFTSHGAAYDEPPIPIFNVIATLAENAAFKHGETVIIKDGIYREVSATNQILQESGDAILAEGAGETASISIDQDHTFFDYGIVSTVLDYDYDRNTIKLSSPFDLLTLMSEIDMQIITETEVDFVHQLSSSFDAGNVVYGLKSGAQATIVNLSRASGLSVIGGQGFTEAMFLDNTGKCNNAASVLADNDKYQDYAYVIKSAISRENYEKVLYDTVHPAGFRMLSETLITSEVELDSLNEIGYNYLKATTYFESTGTAGTDKALSTHNVVDTLQESNDIFGDYVKFNLQRMPIEAVLPLTLRQSSNRIFMSVFDYNAPALTTSNLKLWSESGGCQITNKYSANPAGAITTTLLTDTTTVAIANINNVVSCAIGDDIIVDFYVLKQALGFTYPAFQFNRGTDDLHVGIDTATGLYEGHKEIVSLMFDLEDFWYVRLKTKATTTSMAFTIYPSYGFKTALFPEAIPDKNALGEFVMSDFIMRNITAPRAVQENGDRLLMENGDTMQHDNAFISLVSALNLTKYVPTSYDILDTEVQFSI